MSQKSGDKQFPNEQWEHEYIGQKHCIKHKSCVAKMYYKSDKLFSLLGH